MSELYTASYTANPDYNNLIKLWKRMGHRVTNETMKELKALCLDDPDGFHEYYRQWAFANDAYGTKKSNKDISKNFDKVQKQYQYNRAREEQGLETLEINSLDWDPGKYDDTGNEALNTWYRKNGDVPKGSQVYDFTLFKNEIAEKEAVKPQSHHKPSIGDTLPKDQKADDGSATAWTKAPQPDTKDTRQYTPDELGETSADAIVNPEYWEKAANLTTNKLKWSESPAGSGGTIYLSDAGKEGKRYVIVPTQDGRYALMWLSDTEASAGDYKGSIEFFSNPNYAKWSAEQYRKQIDEGTKLEDLDSKERMFLWVDRLAAWKKDPLGKPLPGGYVSKGDENTWWGKLWEGNALGGLAGALSVPQELYLNLYNAGMQAVKGEDIRFRPGMTNRDFMAENAKRFNTVDIGAELDKVPVLGALANFSLEMLTDPTVFLPGGAAYDALKARGLASAANIEYVKAFANQKVLGQRYNPLSRPTVPTKAADEAADVAADATADAGTNPTKDFSSDAGDIYLSGKEGKPGVGIEDIMNASENTGADKIITQIEYKPSSGVVLKPNPQKTTTVLGNFGKDMKNIISEMGNVKSTYFGGKKGGFNVLNVPDDMYKTADQFWDEVNKPWLDEVIKRGDDIVLATKPEGRTISYFDRGTQTEVFTGFGREYRYLLDKGYVYDSITNMMIRK